MKIKKSFETETYTTAAGYYAIHQELEFGDRVALILTPEQMRLLIVDMEHHLNDLSWSEA